MPDTLNNVRVRFAPSPTGFLHIGGARTALFNYLFAKKHKGSFILRVEDTDAARNTKEAHEAILHGLKWLGLNWDEGPLLQSERLDLYRHGASDLLKNGLAYRCDCSVEELEAKRQAAQKSGKKPMYDGKCRTRNIKTENSVIRFKAPTDGNTIVNDLIKGEVTFQNSELDDMVLVRTDGMPTYNFVVTVDDADLNISHVIRGDDHLNNTPKQIQLYQAMKKPIPKFAHVPLILGQDKSRLSKRHGATSVDSYREMGYLPQAMNNFLVRLGWSHGDQEIFSPSEMIQAFDLEHIGKSAGVFNSEKLDWLNHHYLNLLSAAELNTQLKPFIKVGSEHLQDAGWPILAKELKERCKKLSDYSEQGAFFFTDNFTYSHDGVVHLKPELAKPLSTLMNALTQTKPWEESQVEATFNAVLDQEGLKLKQLAQGVRVALTGTTTSPGIYRLIVLLGAKRVEDRFQRALEFIRQGGK